MHENVAIFTFRISVFIVLFSEDDSYYQMIFMFPQACSCTTVLSIFHIVLIQEDIFIR